MIRIILVILAVTCLNARAENNPTLASLYEHDQAERKEMASGGAVVDVKDDLARRLEVNDLLLDGTLTTGEDYIRALMILQHTSLWFYTDDLMLSMSPENHLLAFKMAKKAHEKGHELGVHFLVWTYNYYAQGVECDMERYGFDVVDKRIVPKHVEVTPVERIDACRLFDPLPTYESLGLISEP